MVRRCIATGNIYCKWCSYWYATHTNGSSVYGNVAAPARKNPENLRSSHAALCALLRTPRSMLSAGGSRYDQIGMSELSRKQRGAKWSEWQEHRDRLQSKSAYTEFARIHGEFKDVDFELGHLDERLDLFDRRIRELV